MYEGAEKRKYKRIEKPYMVRFQIKQYKGLEISTAEWDMVALKDLSTGGVLFNYNKNLGIGTVLDLKIGFSTSAPPLECAGIVTRVKEQQYTSIFGIAVAFTEIGAQEKEMINKAAVEILGQKNQISRTLV